MRKHYRFWYGCIILSGLLFGPVNPIWGANANLLVSAENTLTSNAIRGSEVIQVVIDDDDIIETDELKGEPDVTVNGKILRMAQGVDGLWYGYFSFVDQARLADQTSLDAGVPGKGLDFGVFASGNTPSSLFGDFLSGVDFSDTLGVALPRDGGLTQFANGTQPVVLPQAAGSLQNSANLNNVVREAVSLNTTPNVPAGQIGLNPNAWPIVQLFSAGPMPGDIITENIDGELVIRTVEQWDPVIVQYNKGGGVQTTTLSLNESPSTQIVVDKAQYAPGDEVLVAIQDHRLNIDPTDRDSWTFHVTGSVSTFYQAFDADGTNSANGTEGLSDFIPHLDDLLFDSSGVMSMTLIQGIEFKANDIQPTTTVDDGSGNTFSQIITLVETGPFTGLFESFDANGQSVLRIADDAQPGVVATLTYGGQTVDIMVVPEPSSLSVLAIWGLLFCRRRGI